MNVLSRTILELLDSEGVARLVYADATGTNTVKLEGVATAVELPALSPVFDGDYAAVLEAGGDRLILGARGGPVTQAGAVTVPLAAAAQSMATVTFADAFTAAPIFVCNLVSSGGIYCASGGAVTASTAEVYTYRTDGANVAVARTVHWVAVGTLA